jgi:hypothetical protein
MNAAETCPTKAIIVENKDTKERFYPLWFIFLIFQAIH